MKVPNHTFLIYGLPIAMILFSILLAISPLLEQYPNLAMGITYDLILTAPLLFIFLSRKNKNSKLHVVAFFILGIVLATVLLPENQQEHLDYIKRYLLPLVELTVAMALIFKIYKGVQLFKSNADVGDGFL